ncbi:hypothetical protein CWATWH0402_4876 [Crocosphaera watsonii WH 0402]|uniref:Uncharacterized protein n=1 Tax=Crocosphaera watsonii WH 0402 TaxID=1284629 RepID=T2JVE2_CROWT|nr:hypothetical protein CWATWH0402_4876 [Crocosphaera watsonii WH 0402]
MIEVSVIALVHSIFTIPIPTFLPHFPFNNVAVYLFFW